MIWKQNIHSLTNKLKLKMYNKMSLYLSLLKNQFVLETINKVGKDIAAKS